MRRTPPPCCALTTPPATVLLEDVQESMDRHDARHERGVSSRPQAATALLWRQKPEVGRGASIRVQELRCCVRAQAVAGSSISAALLLEVVSKRLSASCRSW